MSLRDEIRAWVLIQGKSQREAARHFDVSRHTVARLLQEEPAASMRRYQRHKETTPKTPVRDLALPSFMVEMLEEQKRTLAKLRENAGAAWEENDLVFPGLKGGYFNPNYLLRLFKKILRRAGLADMRLHDLRHSTF